jgi:hypothetical protein
VLSKYDFKSTYFGTGDGILLDLVFLLHLRILFLFFLLFLSHRVPFLHLGGHSFLAKGNSPFLKTGTTNIIILLHRPKRKMRQNCIKKYINFS